MLCVVPCCVMRLVLPCRVLGPCRQGRVLISCPGGVCHVCCGGCTWHPAGWQGAGTAVPEGRGRQGCLPSQHAGEQCINLTYLGLGPQQPLTEGGQHLTACMPGCLLLRCAVPHHAMHGCTTDAVPCCAASFAEPVCWCPLWCNGPDDSSTG